MRNAMLVCGLSLMLAAGCMKTKPVAFGQDNRPLAMEMEKAVDKQDKTTIGKIVKMANSRAGSNKISSSEHVVLKACQEYAEAGKWDDAKKLIGDCLKAK